MIRALVRRLAREESGWALVTAMTLMVVMLGVGTATFGYPVPRAPSLIGMEYLFQAFVPDAAAGNALGAHVTNALLCVVGSR